MCAHDQLKNMLPLALKHQSDYTYRISAFFLSLKIVFFQPKGPQNASHITRSDNFRQLHHRNIPQKKEQSTAVTMLL